MAARFALTDLQVNLTGLSSATARPWPNSLWPAVSWTTFSYSSTGAERGPLRKLAKRSNCARQSRLNYFWINKGPWSNLDGFEAFLPDVPKRKPEGANFYPAGMTKEEFDAWAATLPEQQQNQAKGFFTVIRRTRTAS